MRSVLASALLALLAGAPEAPPRVTYFAQSLLSRCQLVVRGRIERRSVLPGGITVATIDVRETLLGESPGPRLALTSADPTYHGERGQQIVVFLRRSEHGRGWETVERFLVEGKEGIARLLMAREYIELQLMPDRRERVEIARALHLANLAAADVWSRSNAIRELGWFTTHWAHTFRHAERDRLDEVREGMKDGTLRGLLTASLRRIDAALGPRATGRTPRPPRPDREKAYLEALDTVRRTAAAADRAGRLAALARARPARIRLDLPAFLDDEAVEVRRAAVRHVGETECTAAVDAVLAALERRGEDLEVRRDAIRALGILRHEPAVPRLAVFLEKDTPLLDPAVFALARIGSEPARRALAALKERTSGDAERDARIRRILAFVESEAFRQQETILDRLRRGKIAADR